MATKKKKTAAPALTYLPVRAAAHELGVSVPTLYRRINSDEVVAEDRFYLNSSGTEQMRLEVQMEQARAFFASYPVRKPVGSKPEPQAVVPPRPEEFVARNHSVFGTDDIVRPDASFAIMGGSGFAGGAITLTGGSGGQPVSNDPILYPVQTDDSEPTLVPASRPRPRPLTIGLLVLLAITLLASAAFHYG
jgi:hypothetical protein